MKNTSSNATIGTKNAVKVMMKISEELKEKLPDSVVCRRVVLVDDWPNGKVSDNTRLLWYE